MELEQAEKDIEQAISMRPEEGKYKRFKEMLAEIIKGKIQAEGKMLDWLVKCAIKRQEKCQKSEEELKAMQVISIKPEKPLELKILRKYISPSHIYRMKKKYAFSLHFFRIEPKKEGDKIWELLKEYQTLAETYWKYTYYYYFSPSSVPSIVLSSLSGATQSSLQDPKLVSFLDCVKLLFAKDAFFGIR